MKRDLLKLGARLALAAATAAAGLIATATPAHADTFFLASCHITGASPCDPNATAGPGFGSVTLTQSGTSVIFDVVLINGNTFVETGAGGGMLFSFNDTLAGSTITSITTTIDGTTVSVIPGGVSGSTNLAQFQADGTGFFTAAIFCTVASDCNGGSTPDFNDLHFTVTNATIAQLTTPPTGVNAAGNIFVADVQCGATQPGCTSGLTGPVDVHQGSVPDGGTTVALLGFALVGVESLRRRFRA